MIEPKSSSDIINNLINDINDINDIIDIDDINDNNDINDIADINENNNKLSADELITNHNSNINDTNELKVKDIELSNSDLSFIAKLLRKSDKSTLLVCEQIRKIYRKRFPELETIVYDKHDYCQIAKILLNDIENTKTLIRNAKGFLSSNILNSISMVATASVGIPLEKNEISFLNEYICKFDGLINDRKLLMNEIEAKIVHILPNFCYLAGPAIAAQLFVYSGSLKHLLYMPGSNIILLGNTLHGAEKIINTTKQKGSKINNVENDGFGILYTHPLVSYAKPEYRKRIVRLLGGKCSLAIKWDIENNGKTTYGEKLLNDIYVAIDNFGKASAPKHIKPLKIEIKIKKNNRGGRRKRRLKQLYGIDYNRMMNNRIIMSKINANDLPDDSEIEV